MENEKVRRLQITKEDNNIKVFAAWKNIYRQLVDCHLQYSKNLLNVAEFAESSFIDDSGSATSSVILDIVQILINELKSQSKAIQNEWESYNKEKTPFTILDGVDGKRNKLLQKEVKDIWTEHKVLENKMRHSQKMFFQSFDLSRSLVEQIQMDDCDEPHRQHLREQFSSVKAKTDVNLAKYKSLFKNEFDARKTFSEKMTKIENKWIDKETEHLQIWVAAAIDLCQRLANSCPRVFTNPMDSNSPYPAIIKRLQGLEIDEIVVSSLSSHLEEHTFPLFKERRMEDIITPPTSSTRINHDVYVPRPNFMKTFETATTQRTSQSEKSKRGKNDSRSSKTQKVATNSRSLHPTLVERAVPVEEYVNARHESQQMAENLVNDDTNSLEDEIDSLKLDDDNMKTVSTACNALFLNKKDQNNIQSSSDTSVVPAVRQNSWQTEKGSEDKEKDKRRGPTKFVAKKIHSPLKHSRNVYVCAVRDYIPKTKDEIRLTTGMKLKQKQGANDSGMAYGWYKKKILGAKKYGYYPVDYVVQYHKSSWSSVRN